MIDKSKLINKDIVSCNLLNKRKINKIFSNFKPDITIHLAAQSLVRSMPLKNIKPIILMQQKFNKCNEKIIK